MNSYKHMNQPIGSTCDDTEVNYYKQKKNWEKKLGQCPHCGLWLNKIIALTNLIEETEKEAYERGRKDGRAIWSEKDVVG